MRDVQIVDRETYPGLDLDTKCLHQGSREHARSRSVQMGMGESTMRLGKMNYGSRIAGTVRGIQRLTKPIIREH